MDTTQTVGLAQAGRKFRFRPFQAIAALGCLGLSVATFACIALWVSGAAPAPPILRTGAGAVHLMLLFVALVLTVAQFAMPKGTRMHRQLGIAWAGSLVLGSLVSFFMHQINGGLSIPHYFSIATLILVPVIAWLGHTRRRLAHRILVTTYVLIFLVWAGVFAFKGDRALAVLFQAPWN